MTNTRRTQFFFFFFKTAAIRRREIRGYHHLRADLCDFSDIGVPNEHGIHAVARFRENSIPLIGKHESHHHIHHIRGGKRASFPELGKNPIYFGCAKKFQIPNSSPEGEKKENLKLAGPPPRPVTEKGGGRSE